MNKQNNGDKHNFLMYVPEIKHTNWKEENGIVTLYFDVTDPIKKFAGWLVKRSPHCDMEFDKLCSLAWLSIDGEKSLYDIAILMSNETGDSMTDAIYRLITCMKYLAKRGWIKFKKVKDIEDNNLNFN